MLIKTVLLGRCPNCGQGPLFAGYLQLAPQCNVCGKDLASADPGDGPAVFSIFFVSVIVVVAAVVTEIAVRPPIWVHIALWVSLTIVLSLAALRLTKSLLVILQFRNDAHPTDFSSGSNGT